MQLNPAVEVTILSPDEPGSSRRVNLFLFRVEENQFLANQDFVAAPGNHLVPPPVSVNLYYLLTVYAQNDTALGNVPAHEILGEAMRVLRQNSPVPRDELAAGLRDARERPPNRLQETRSRGAEPHLGDVWQTVSALGAVRGVLWQLDLLSAATHGAHPRPAGGYSWCSRRRLATIDRHDGPGARCRRYVG